MPELRTRISKTEKSIPSFLVYSFYVMLALRKFQTSEHFQIKNAHPEHIEDFTEVF